MRDLDSIVQLLKSTPVPHAERIKAISSEAVFNICSVIAGETTNTILKQHPAIISSYTDAQIHTLKTRFQSAGVMGGWIYGLEHEVTRETIQIPSSPHLETFISNGIKEYFYTQEKNSQDLIPHDVLEAFKYCKTEGFKMFMDDSCFNVLPSDTKMAIVLQYVWVIVMSYGAYKLQDLFTERY